jgi:RND family efflux transporter MFP subunit
MERISFLLLLLVGCRKAPDVSPPLPVVTVRQPVKQPVTDYLDLTGTVAPSKTVNLVARVSGYLQSVGFQDGSVVEAGQVLFVIDPQQYQQQLALNEAALKQAQTEYERQQQLIKENATAVSSVEKQLSQRDQAKAQMELAKINLAYTRVTAPFSGRIGARQVDPGNLVGANGPTTLATLDQLMPIYVNFSLNEHDALHLYTEMRQRGMAPKSNVGKLPVFVGLSNEQAYPHAGVLNFSDNEISTSTGTIAMRAMLPNKDRALFPGLFARVRIPLGGPQVMLVIPNTAIGSDQQGDYVFVVDAGEIVARRGIVKGPLTADGGCAIRSGLSEGDRVIVNGILNAKAGEKVAPTGQP